MILTFKLLIKTQFAYAPPNWQEYSDVLNVREDITIIRRRWLPPLPPTSGSRPVPPHSPMSQPPLPGYDFYRAPFTDFPIIRSHVHPFCVIYNAGQKLTSKALVTFTPPPHINPSDLFIIITVYNQLTAPAPPTWGHGVPSIPREPPGDEGGSPRRSRQSDDPGPSTRKRRAFVEANRALQKTGDTTGNTGHVRRHDAHSPERTCTPDTSMTAVTPEPAENLAPCEDFVHLPQSFEDWMDGVAAHEEGNTPLLNDHQIGGYVRERARKPLKYPWHAWRVDWGHTPEPDTSRFSSNDWAYWMRTRYLTL